MLTNRGVFRVGWGPLCHGPPLLVARIVKLHRKVSEIEACPPLCKFGIRFDHKKGMFCAFLLGIGLKIGANVSEDLLFFFRSSPDFGRKIGLNLSRIISDSDLRCSQIFCRPPLFKILPTLLLTNALYWSMFSNIFLC